MKSQTQNFFTPLYWVAMAIFAIALGYGIAAQTTVTVVLVSILATLLVIRKKLLWGVVMVAFLPVIGELVRLPFGGDNGILISDIAIAVMVATWIVQKMNSRRPFPKTPFDKPLIAFTIIAVFSLLLSLTFLKISEVAAGSLYLVRFIEYALLGVITFDVVRGEKEKTIVLKSLVISALLITIAGFIQLLIHPDLSDLVAYGWDPHQNRLVSTWLDPNFIAGFLSFMLAILASIAVCTKGVMKKLGLLALIAVMAVALFLTYSRSGYLAALAALLVIGILQSRKLLIGGIIIIVIGLGLLPRADQRINDLVNSAESLLMNTNQSLDPTAALRVISWEQTLQLIEEHPVLGVGYNTLKYVKLDRGFVDDTGVHSASGSDSSLLTILATTGIVGLIPFILIYWNALALSFRNWRNKKLPALWRGYGLGIFAGIIALLVHSFFVNSLLYPEILTFLWIGLGLLTPSDSTAAL